MPSHSHRATAAFRQGQLGPCGFSSRKEPEGEQKKGRRVCVLHVRPWWGDGALWVSQSAPGLGHMNVNMRHIENSAPKTVQYRAEGFCYLYLPPKRCEQARKDSPYSA